MNTKICNKCKVEKPVVDFYPRCKSKFGVRGTCRKCNDVTSKEYYAKNKEKYSWNSIRWHLNNPDKVKHCKLKREYGITIKQFVQMFEAQGGCCKICKEHVTGNVTKHRLCVDHCHTTKIVRGLLCDRCNKGLGYFKDNPDRLIEAAQYLRKGSAL